MRASSCRKCLATQCPQWGHGVDKLGKGEATDWSGLLGLRLRATATPLDATDAYAGHPLEAMVGF